jgi:putative protease
MKKIELLAPAGSMDALRAAISAGADAVYLGGKMFGARAFSNNFGNEELVEAINYAHLRNVRVYVTTNTIIYDREVDNFLEYIEFLYKNNVDGLIMQDIGMMDIVRQKYPDIEIHASTQMHIHNLDGVKLLEKLGVKRTVLARETSIEEIKHIRENSKIELEIFIHGALCVSYSGECYMSTLAGNRSGNRGTCAQCCRERYTLLTKDNDLMTKLDDGYLLSTKDLNTLDNIGELIDLGVDSLKIEGRMKRPEYVYYVVSLYRKAIDSYINTGKVNITDEEIFNLKKLFNRGFTKGFIFNEDNNNFTNKFRPNHMGVPVGKVVKVKGKWVDIKLTDTVNIKDGIRFVGNTEDNGLNLNTFFINHELVKTAHSGDIISLEVNNGKVALDSEVLKTTDNEQIEELDKLIDNDKKIPLDMQVIIQKDKPLTIKLFSDKELTYESKYVPEKALKSPTSKERIIEQLSKLGNTIYNIRNIDVTLDDGLFVDIKEINELRRNAIDELDTLRLQRDPRMIKDYHVILPDFNQTNYKSVLVRTMNHYNQIKDANFDTIYMDSTLYNKIDDSRKVLKMPRVIKEYPSIDNEVMVGELGGITKFDHVDTDFSLNVTNSYSVAFLHSQGVKKVTLSYELTYEQVKDLIDNYHERYHKHPNLEVITYGYLEAMINKYNLFNKYKQDNLYLQDKFKNLYYIKDYGNYMIIYDNRIRNLKEDYYSIGVNSTRVELLKENDYSLYK